MGYGSRFLGASEEEHRQHFFQACARPASCDDGRGLASRAEASLPCGAIRSDPLAIADAGRSAILQQGFRANNAPARDSGTAASERVLRQLPAAVSWPNPCRIGNFLPLVAKAGSRPV